MLGRRRLHQDLDRQDRPAATLPVTLVMLEAVRDFRGPPAPGGRQSRRRHPQQQGRVRTSCCQRDGGDDWLDPDWFRSARRACSTTC
jgi:deoxyribose-phosphate aldolase